MDQEKTIIQTYQEKGTVKEFDSMRWRYEYQRYKHQIEISFLKKTLKKHNAKIKILDVACGTGRMLETVAKVRPLSKYYGLDTSKTMINELNKKAKKIKFKTNLKIADATKIPYKDNYFDVVYTYHLLWHLPEKTQKKILKEMLRVTKSGGHIIFDILNKDFIWEKTKDILNMKKIGGLYKLKVPEVKKFLSKHNCKIEKLSDFPIKNDSLYSIANVVNKFRKSLPYNLFHMIYFEVKKT